ncbi:ras-related protein rab-32 [Anaeramoeba flamelloides]|uniref:Ras-related protein Rab n=1 Tax=Anaeramoeba flamelloides TaxID=1746091 RepID=A0AAV7YVR3_9EUKA|nr:ras-related protein rab-32 [Anaeramoeba flamelloides]KAJ6246983.1 ras-related protein rab-32 [Anaeramoeba flamelloides]
MNETSNLNEYLYKVLVIGVTTGKTSIIQQYVHGIFSRKYKATIGVDFALKVLNVDEETTVRIQLWDIAGQERYGNMTRVYYKEAVGALLVFDVTRMATFEAVIKWKEDVDQKVRTKDDKPIPVVLVANKIDLVNEKEGWGKTEEEMNNFCKEHGFIGWFATSAKENKNIGKATRFLVDHILKNDIKHAQNGGDGFNLDDEEDVEKPSGGCC